MVKVANPLIEAFDEPGKDNVSLPIQGACRRPIASWP
jgi:hypothetical protein